MIVGTLGTGEYSMNVPVPSGNGTHEGCMETSPVAGSCHRMTLSLSHPHPGTPATPDGTGLSPTNPSSVAATSSTWAPQDGIGEFVNVRSDTAKCFARRQRVGTSVRVRNCE